MNARCSLGPLLVLVGCAVVAAMPAPARAQAGRDNVLVLGVQRGGKVDAKLSHNVYACLAKAGETLAKENALAGPERLCGNEECMGMLASREGAQSVVGAQVKDTSPTNQFVTVLVFDADRRVKVEESTICDHCSPPQLLAAVCDLGTRSLRSQRERRTTAVAATAPTPAAPSEPGAAPAPTAPDGQAGTPPPPPPVATSPAPAPSGDYLSRWPTRRKVAAGVLAGLLVATLIPTVALHATDGSETTTIGCASAANFCVLKNMPLYAAGYAISGALAVGLAITFAWPTPKAAPTQDSAPVTAEGK